VDIDCQGVGQDATQYPDAFLHRSTTLRRFGGSPGRPVAAGVTFDRSAHRLTPLRISVTGQPRCATDVTQSW